MTSTAQSNIKAQPSNVVSLIAFLVLFWALSCLVLWLAYDMGLQVRGGYYQENQALVLVAQMGLIVAVLTGIIWTVVAWRRTERRGWRLGWSVTWRTWIILILYVALVLFRREMWTPSQGTSDGAMFLPIVGHTNAHFLAEAEYISFLLQVIPVAGLLSGGLYYWRNRVLERQIAHRTSVEN